MDYITAPNGIARLQGIKWAYMVEDNIILINYEKGGSLLDYGGMDRLRLIYPTNELASIAMRQLQEHLGGKFEMVDTSPETPTNAAQ